MKVSLIFISILTAQVFAATRTELQQQLEKNHRPLSYQDARTQLFNKVDNRDKVICSLYSPSECQKWGYESVYKYRLEHVWPQSQGAGELPANSDLHHLFVATRATNSKRANLPFCNVAVADWEHDGSKQGIDIDYTECFEPADRSKGDVARAMFYFSIRYNMNIESPVESTLREWNRLDPVSDFEKERNDIIESLQGNRNIFIDKPDLIAAIKDF